MFTGIYHTKIEVSYSVHLNINGNKFQTVIPSETQTYPTNSRRLHRANYSLCDMDYMTGDACKQPTKPCVGRF